VAVQNALEVELKLTLDDEASYGLVRGWLDRVGGAVDARRQVNIYLETADRGLAQARAMLRVRLDGACVVATLKERPELVDGLMRTAELEVALSTEQAARWRGVGASTPAVVQIDELPAAIGHALRRLLGDPPRPLHVLGALVNERRTYTLHRRFLVAPTADVVADGGVDARAAAAESAAGESVQVDLDATLGAAGQPRFELELEDADAAVLRDGLEAQLFAIGATWRPTTESKYRFFLRGCEAGEARWRDAGGGDEDLAT
jgi:uncharacterized protein YjbK